MLQLLAVVHSKPHRTPAFHSGYGCFGLDPASTNLLGFGVDLLPDRMCGCLPGFSGRVTNCTPCGNLSFNADFNETSCRSCPDQMFTDEMNAKYETACKCSVGRQRVGNVCGCTAQQARGYGDVCIPCGELHLDCSEHGIEATDAPAVDGYARLDPCLLEWRECGQWVL